MTFDIWFGIPEIRDFWLKISEKVSTGNATKDEAKLHKKLLKVFKLLSSNPRHNSLNTHEIAIEHHPNNSKYSYDKITLSGTND